MIFITRLIDRVTSSGSKPATPEVLTDAEIAERKKHRYSDDYLFERHPKEEIRRWVYNLDYGYYHRASGGHANDMDYFSIAFHYNSKRDFLRTMSKLGIPLYKIKKEDPRLVPGVSYTADEWDKLREEIKDFPEYDQPGLIHILGVKCVCTVHQGEIRLSFLGDNYEVTDSDFQNVKKVERLVKETGLSNKVSRRATQYTGCISDTYYADLLK